MITKQDLLVTAENNRDGFKIMVKHGRMSNGCGVYSRLNF
jgi:hypothetical protein